MTATPHILMARPTHYEVAYKINPWMKPTAWRDGGAANNLAAERAWSALRGALEAAGAKVHAMAGVAGVPDLVCPATAAVVLNRTALLARFRHEQRQAEEPYNLAALEGLRAAGVLDRVVAFDDDIRQEGAGDCIWDASRGIFWVASGPRSSPDSLARIAQVFGEEVVHMPLATERYYHLDTCFCPLSGGEVLYYPPALSPDALAALHARTRPDERLIASDEDAEAFCVNAVSIGRKVIMARPPARLAARLAERGYRVTGVDLDPFLLSGGGAFCMTLRLDLMSETVLAAPALLTA
jgi:N-dimethylarginine dimethylaminohydrolase